jgi:hypothetical protein
VKVCTPFIAQLRHATSNITRPWDNSISLCFHTSTHHGGPRNFHFTTSFLRTMSLHYLTSTLQNKIHAELHKMNEINNTANYITQDLRCETSCLNKLLIYRHTNIRFFFWNGLYSLPIHVYVPDTTFCSMATCKLKSADILTGVASNSKIQTRKNHSDSPSTTYHALVQIYVTT